MESTATQPARKYYCHHCNATIYQTPPDFECPQCNLGFIEKLPDGPLSTSSFSGRNNENGDEVSSMVFDTVSNNMGNIFEVMLRHNENNLGNSSDRPSSSSRRDNSNSGRNDVRQLRNQSLEHVLSEFLSMSQNGSYTDNNAPVFLVGNPGDYAWGREGLDTIVTQLFNQMDSSGPPPLAKEKIQDLPLINVTKEHISENIQCSVCWDSFRTEDKVRQLPCEHIYHDPCIVPWLQLHGTCPICRQLLCDEGDRISGFSGGLEALLRDVQRELGRSSHSSSWSRQRQRNVRCYQCQRMGHYASECPSRWGSARPPTDDSNWNSEITTGFNLMDLSFSDDSEFDVSNDDDSDLLYSFLETIGGRLDSGDSSLAGSSSGPIYDVYDRLVNRTQLRRNQRRCFNWNRTGHLARDCRQPNTKPRCRNCRKYGHETKDCWFLPFSQRDCTAANDIAVPSSSRHSGGCDVASNYENRSSTESPSSSLQTRYLFNLICWNCSREGHKSRECPDPRRPLDKRTCFICGSVGHLRSTCSFNKPHF